jgi:hypothetical protein
MKHRPATNKPCGYHNMRSPEMLPASPVAAMKDASIKVPSAPRCALTIFALKVSLRCLGFARTIQLIRRRIQGVHPSRAPNVGAIQATEHAVAMAGAFYPGRALCLEQSLALYYLLRRQGVAVRYRQGVQAHPFAAHAWVEYEGVVLNDVRERIRPFTLLPELLP